MTYSRLQLLFVASVTFIACLVAMPAKAEKLSNLYTATWPVDSQATSARTQAIKNSLQQVLIRASGSKDVVRAPAIQSALSDAESYLRRYSYQRLSAAEQMIYEKPLLLKATFDQQSIVNLLKSASLPIWGEDRPSGIFWIALDNGGERRIASDQTRSIVAALDIAAQSRGLPVSLPLMDIDDQSALEVADVWGRFEAPVEAASKRYGSDYWVAASLSEGSNQWQATWKVNLYGQTQTFTTSGLSAYEAIQGAVNRIADALASKLAVSVVGTSTRGFDFD